ncbi:efflux RND transporter permease subunit [Nocardioides sp. CFH 31398]|uniref:MMPL family transporter n=1 Tax=Nocardioides sp. CFH 31398 TaxID=2919579 RepID=UPI001F05A3D2|nr:efflux RND transporter permease subunit [Nocardioides sp. CFH 31398]MCH1867219.1 efflux RND transporter permease subunit [Nocardioides sp. CFH 31398]
MRHRLVTTIVGRRTAWLVALVPILLAGLMIGAVGEAERDASPTDALPAGLDSTEGAALLAEQPEDAGSSVLVLWTGDRDDVRAATGDLERAAGSIGAVPAGGDSPVTVSDDGTAAIAVVPVRTPTATDAAEVVGDLRTDLRGEVPDGLDVAVTGPAAVQADLASVFDGANVRLLAVTALVVAVLLVITYRSPVLWIVPLAVVGVADRLGAVVATRLLEATGQAWDESTVGILSVLVFGAGTNYALLLISRYRDELRRHDDRREAMALALRRTVEPVVASATTVVLGLLCLLLALTPTTRGLGLACAAGVVVAAFFVLVVLPAALVLPGRWIFWPKVPRVGQTALADSPSVWRRIGTRVQARPGTLVVASGLVLVALAAGLTQLRTGLDTDDQFLETPEAISAATRLGESFPAGLSDPTTVVSRAPADDVAAALDGVDGVGAVTPGRAEAGVSTTDVVLDAEPGSDDAEATIGWMRDALADLPDTHVTGSEAEAVDEAAGASRDRLVIFPLILGLVLVALVLLLRALVAPLLLVAAVVATYAAALGVSWWVFAGVLGFSAVDSTVPLFAFLFLVALGVDYSIFLVTRAREEARSAGTASGMLRALAATGGVITSAGILLAAVFAVLGVLPLVVLAQLGTVICIGVLLDTLLVRTVVVPSLAVLLEERFWWPGRVVPAAAGVAAEEPGQHRPGAHRAGV